MDEQQEPVKKPNFFSRWWNKTSAAPMRFHEKLIAGLMVVVFLFVFYLTLDANKYAAQVLVIEGEGKVGVNPTAESLDFGDLSRGTAAVRRVSIENGTPVPMYIAIFKWGSISDLVKIDQNFFTLGAKESTKIEFTTYMPASAPIGEKYTGRVYLFKIPTFGL